MKPVHPVLVPPVLVLSEEPFHLRIHRPAFQAAFPYSFQVAFQVAFLAAFPGSFPAAFPDSSCSAAECSGSSE